MPIYEHHQYKDYELPFILNHHSITDVRPEYEWNNMHENIEIIFVVEGEAIVHIDGVEVKAIAGDTVILGSNVLHAVGTCTSAKYHYLIVDRAFCVENHFDTNRLSFNICVHDKTIHGMLRDLTEAYSCLNKRNYAKQEIRARVLLLMSYICENYSVESTQSNDVQSLYFAKLAISYIYEHFSSPISLDEVARAVGISKFYFIRAFRAATGDTFVKFVNKVRCDHAKQMLLSSSKTVNRICDECGFVTPSYFSRTFKKYVGYLPSEYREIYKKT